MADEAPEPPEELRCIRNDGKSWRCKHWRIHGKKLCEEHYLRSIQNKSNRKTSTPTRAGVLEKSKLRSERERRGRRDGESEDEVNQNNSRRTRYTPSRAARVSTKSRSGRKRRGREEEESEDEVIPAKKRRRSEVVYSVKRPDEKENLEVEDEDAVNEIIRVKMKEIRRKKLDDNQFDELREECDNQSDEGSEELGEEEEGEDDKLSSEEGEKGKSERDLEEKRSHFREKEGVSNVSSLSLEKEKKEVEKKLKSATKLKEEEVENEAEGEERICSRIRDPMFEEECENQSNEKSVELGEEEEGEDDKLSVEEGKTEKGKSESDLVESTSSPFREKKGVSNVSSSSLEKEKKKRKVQKKLRSATKIKEEENGAEERISLSKRNPRFEETADKLKEEEEECDIHSTEKHEHLREEGAVGSSASMEEEKKNKKVEKELKSATKVKEEKNDAVKRSPCLRSPNPAYGPQLTSRVNKKRRHFNKDVSVRI